MIGLKENVCIGKLIPAGTGMKRYRSVQLDTGEELFEPEEIEELTEEVNEAEIDDMDLDEDIDIEAEEFVTVEE